MRKILLGTTRLALAFGIIATPDTAQALWRGGVRFYGPGMIIGPPVFYAPPPPIYYAPDPICLAPPSGQTCYAGA